MSGAKGEIWQDAYRRLRFAKHGRSGELHATGRHGHVPTLEEIERMLVTSSPQA